MSCAQQEQEQEQQPEEEGRGQRIAKTSKKKKEKTTLKKTKNTKNKNTMEGLRTLPFAAAFVVVVVAAEARGAAREQLPIHPVASVARDLGLGGRLGTMAAADLVIYYCRAMWLWIWPH